MADESNGLTRDVDDYARTPEYGRPTGPAEAVRRVHNRRKTYPENDQTDRDPEDGGGTPL